MENLFRKSGMFATPSSIDDMQAYVAQFNGNERVIAGTVMAMTWNLAHELLAEELAKEPQETDLYQRGWNDAMAMVTKLMEAGPVTEKTGEEEDEEDEEDEDE